MKLILTRIVILLSLVALPVLSYAQQAKLADLNWLAGCWAMKDDKHGIQITEMWMKPEGDAMLGVGRTVKAGKMIDFEFLRIVTTANGLAYVSRPSANKEDTVFPLLRSSATELVFENMDHDFPQRIIYRRTGENLNARIEGTKDGKTRGVDFPYMRAKCE